VTIIADGLTVPVSAFHAEGPGKYQGLFSAHGRDLQHPRQTHDHYRIDERRRRFHAAYVIPDIATAALGVLMSAFSRSR